MYECQDCRHIFDVAKRIVDKHELDTPPYEEHGVCPSCGSSYYHKIAVLHCRCCGARLSPGKSEYCNDSCRKRGIELRKIEQIQRRVRQTAPIEVLVRQIDEYNRLHNTRYSYGQYVALILPKLKGNNKRDT